MMDMKTVLGLAGGIVLLTFFTIAAVMFMWMGIDFIRERESAFTTFAGVMIFLGGLSLLVVILLALMIWGGLMGDG
jgi:hypothetical protein